MWEIINLFIINEVVKMRKGLQNLENSENRNYKIVAVDDEE